MTTEHPNLSLDLCRARQHRLREKMEEMSIDRAIVVSHENVQYLTGFRPHRLMQAIVVIDVDDQCVLCAPNQEPDRVAADEVVTYKAQRCATLRQDQLEAAMTATMMSCHTSPDLFTAIEFSSAAVHVSMYAGDCIADLDQVFQQLRRRKDPDEINMIRHAVACTEAMYAAARDIIRPGITELEVYNQLHAAAVCVAGEPLTALGNDFQCNSPGGPPRDRAARDGELFILDLGPSYRGYYADNCRTIAVNGRPTDEQHRAWEAIVAVLEMVEQTVRPGVSCRDVYARAKAMLDEYHPGAFPHHLGHGFGLFPHETPHLNPHWDDTFEEGDTFTAEPGLYTDDLKAGIRLEQNYVVTADGVDRLTNFSLDL